MSSPGESSAPIRQAASSFGWSSIQGWGNQLIQLVIFSMLARLLDPRDIGLVAFANIFIICAQLLSMRSFGDTLVQHKEVTDAHYTAVFWLNTLLSLLWGTVFLVASPWIALQFGMPGLIQVLPWLCLGVLIEGLTTVQDAHCRRQLQFRLLAIRRLAGSLIGGTIGIFLAWQGAGVYALVAQFLISSLAGTLLLWRTSSWRPSGSIEWAKLKELCHFGFHRAGSNFLAFATKRIDDFFVGSFLGPAALGYYSIAYRILMSLNTICTNVITSAAFPLFSRSQHDQPAMERLFLTVSKGGVLFGFLIFPLVWAFSPELICLIFGEEWLPAAPAMRLLAIAGLAQNIIFLNRAFLTAQGRADTELRMMLFLTGANALGFYFAAHHSIEAVAWVLVVNFSIFAPFLAVFNLRHSSDNLIRYFKGLGLPALASSSGLVSLWIFKKTCDWPLLATLAAGGMLYAGLYTGLVWLLNKELAIQLKELWQSRKKKATRTTGQGFR